MSEFDPIHAVCVRLRNEPCQLCPRQEPSVYGPCVRGCRALAEEVANIAKHGNPWGASARGQAVDRWKENFNRE